MEFYRADPTPLASWRLVVLMGANSRTYKFPLADALLEHARMGRSDVALPELATSYAMRLVEHLEHAPQAPERSALGDRDFLGVARREAAQSLHAGQPTDLLLHAAIRSMPAMVMQKFHNLRDAGAQSREIAHRFYEIVGPPRRRIVRLTRELTQLAHSEQLPLLRDELAARWNIVETSFAARIGRSLIEEGFALDHATMRLTDRRRRRSVAGLTEAVIGFQHGLCLICNDVLGQNEPIAVDHVFPFALMYRVGVLGWHGPDLDAIWNLAPTHASCNTAKGAAPPSAEQMRRLAARNTAIMGSPHPLRTTLGLVLSEGNRTRTTSWFEFIAQVDRLIRT